MCFVVLIVMLTFGKLSNDSFEKGYSSGILTLSDCPLCFGALLVCIEFSFYCALGLKS